MKHSCCNQALSRQPAWKDGKGAIIKHVWKCLVCRKRYTQAPRKAVKKE